MKPSAQDFKHPLRKAFIMITAIFSDIARCRIL